MSGCKCVILNQKSFHKQVNILDEKRENSPPLKNRGNLKNDHKRKNLPGWIDKNNTHATHKFIYKHSYICFICVTLMWHIATVQCITCISTLSDFIIYLSISKLKRCTICKMLCLILKNTTTLRDILCSFHRTVMSCKVNNNNNTVFWTFIDMLRWIFLIHFTLENKSLLVITLLLNSIECACMNTFCYAVLLAKKTP